MPRTRQVARATPGDRPVPGPPADRIIGSAPDVFGLSHPLYEPIAATTRLPDVLTRIVIHYASHLYPRQAHYAGNVVLTHPTSIQHTATGATSSSSTPGTSSIGSFSLRDRSWSMCGWMSRAKGGIPQFLLSLHASEQATPNNTHAHIGYTCHPHGGATNCFTVGFYANDLDLTPPAIDVDEQHEWEHWCTTLHYPRPDDCGPYIPPATEHTNAEYKDPHAPNLARRRLYRNGLLMAEDDCQPPDIDGSHTLLLGRYDQYHFSSLQGGLCDVRLYSRALEADEVHALYAGEEHAERSKEALEMWYRLDSSDFDARVVRDSSGHGRHAMVDGAPPQLSVMGGCDKS